MKEVLDKIDPTHSFSDKEILFELRRAHGIEPGLFIPEEASKNLIRYGIEEFKPACYALVKKICDELKATAFNLTQIQEII